MSKEICEKLDVNSNTNNVNVDRTFTMRNKEFYCILCNKQLVVTQPHQCLYRSTHQTIIIKF